MSLPRLKDSDVTWLYGPLHTAVDPVPLRKAATAEERLGLATSHTSPNSGSKTVANKANKGGKSARRNSGSSSRKPQLTVKPILKHRSLSDILSVPSSGHASPSVENMSVASYDNSEDESDVGAAVAAARAGTGGINDENDEHMYHSNSSGEGTPVGDGARTPDGRSEGSASHSRTSSVDSSASGRRRSGSGSGSGPQHPGVVRTRTLSDSSNRSSPQYEAAHFDLPGERPGFRRGSSHDHALRHASASAGSYPAMPKKRHITFNHRVDQCISLDVDEIQRLNAGRNASAVANDSKAAPYSNQLHRYGSNTSSSRSSSSSSSSGASSTESSDDDDDDEEEQVLSFRSSSPKSANFIKPLIHSPTDPNGPASAASGATPRSPHGSHESKKESSSPHTIAKLAPTTLKEFELLPGPTPIVVFEDGKITALYGTEQDYIFDAEEHRGMGEWLPPHKDDVPEHAVVTEDEELDGDADDDEDDDAMHGDVDLAAHQGAPLQRTAGRDALLDDEHYNEQPAQTMAEEKPVSTSDRYASGDAEGGSNAKQAAAMGTGKANYFAGPEAPMGRDLYDSAGYTSSQAKYGASALRPPGDYSEGTSAGAMHAHGTGTGTATGVSSASSSGTVSPSIPTVPLSIASDSTSTNIGIGLSSSPSSAGRFIPGKSILKKGRDPQGPGSAEYYPPVPPASTRASRAHATMFDENGDEVAQSPRKASDALPDGGALPAPTSTSGSASTARTGERE